MLCGWRCGGCAPWRAYLLARVLACWMWVEDVRDVDVEDVGGCGRMWVVEDVVGCGGCGWVEDVGDAGGGCGG